MRFHFYILTLIYALVFHSCEPKSKAIGFENPEWKIDTIKINDVSSRFGCWTCTVVRKDKSMGNMIENGYTELKELYEFRNWIAVFRDNIKYRCSYRRNGVKGLGPITLEGRKIILDKLLKTEQLSGLNLISQDEINRIYELWEIDELNVNYQEKRLTATCIING